MAHKIRQEKLWIEFENHLLNEGLSESRRDKLKMMWKYAESGIKKDFDSVERADVEKYVNDLNRNKITKKDGKPLSGSTKSDIKKFLKQFYKWRKGDNEEYPKLVSWIKTRISKDERPEEKEIVSIQEIKKLALSFPKIEQRIMTLLLFDSGFRIQELLSITKKAISWEDFDEENKCFWIKCSKSKTIVRKVPVPLFTEDLQTFINSSYYTSLKENERLFPFSYNAYLKTFKTCSKSILKKDLAFHNLRHSSATYYAKEYNGNSMALADRYGWTYNSKELQTYIRNSGQYQKQGAKMSYSNKVRELEEKIDKQNEEIKKLRKFMEAWEIIYKNPAKLKVLNKILE